jgi:type IV pilus assembly protein PilB
MSAVIQGPAAAGTLTGLARALVQQGKLRPDRAENFARKALQSNTQFIDELIESTDTTGLDPRTVAKFAADTFGHPLLDLGAVDHDQLPRDIIDRKLVSALRVIALRKRGNRLSVAMSDPTNLQALDQIKFQTQLAIDIVVVEHDKLMRLVDASAQSTAQALEAMVGDEVSFEELLGESPDTAAAEDTAQAEVDDAPVVRFLQKLLLDAIGEGASDLHF